MGKPPRANFLQKKLGFQTVLESYFEEDSRPHYYGPYSSDMVAENLDILVSLDCRNEEQRLFQQIKISLLRSAVIPIL